MSANLPTYNNNYPVMNPPKVQLDVEGHEALAKLGKSLSSEASQALALHQASEFQKAKVAAQTSVQADPSAANIQQQLANLAGAKGGLESVPLNLNNRLSLSRMLDNELTQFHTFTSGVQLRQARLVEAETLSNDLPSDLQTIGNGYLSGDHQTASDLSEALQGRLEHALKAGSISPQYYHNAIQLLHAVHDKASALMSLVHPDNQDDFTPDKFHALQSFGFDKGVARPVKQSVGQTHTGLSFDIHNQDSNFTDFVAEAHQGQVNTQAYLSMSADKAQAALQVLNGIQTAKGVIQSNQSYPVIMSRMATLSKNPNVTVSEKAELNHYRQFTHLLSTDFPAAMNETAQGEAIIDRYNAATASIKDDSSLSDAERADKMNQVTQQYYRQLVSQAHALNVPANLIKPIPKTALATAESAFQLGGDPNALVKFMQPYANSSVGVYAANSFDTPRQQEIANLVRLNAHQDTAALLPMMIQANQMGQDYSNLLMKDGEHQSDIMSAINTKGFFTHPAIYQSLNYISALPNSSQRVSTIKSLLSNMVLFQASAHNDPELSNLSAYMDKANRLMQESYQIKSGHSSSAYSFNLKTLPITSAQAAGLSDYVLQDRCKHYLQQHTGASDEAVLAGMSNQPFLVTNTPDGNLIVVNRHLNQVVCRVPFSQHLLIAAQHQAQQQQKVLMKKAKTMPTLSPAYNLVPFL